MEVGREHSSMHERNVPEMPLMITRTTGGRAKESFFRVWHEVSFSDTLNHGNPAESISYCCTPFPFHR